jgi:hypothetical protein
VVRNQPCIGRDFERIVSSLPGETPSIATAPRSMGSTPPEASGTTVAVTTPDQDWLVSRIHELTRRDLRPPVRVSGDTSDYASILGGDVLVLGGRHYFVLGDTTEGRFGIDDQPKLWVKRAVQLESGEHKIIKLVFYEDFAIELHKFRIRCSRSPGKESRALQAAQGSPWFMQGATVLDDKGNLVRIIDFIRGPSLYSAVHELRMEHEPYFHEVFPGVFRSVLGAIQALELFEQQGLQHGDVRNDHLLVERSTGQYKWIDFDLGVNFSDYDLWSLGNVLCFVAAKGVVTFREATSEVVVPRQARDALERADASVFFPYRVMNLAKLFAYLPEALARVLRRFSAGGDIGAFYRSRAELVDDLADVEARLGPATRPLVPRW